MIEVLQGFPENVIAVACSGHVTKQDYETVLIPRVRQTLAKHQAVRLYYQIGVNFRGIEPGAIWEDFKVGMEHALRWQRIAVVTDVEWIRHTIRAFGFLIPGDVKIFPVAEQAQAREWIVAT
jgi:hypothetical protein